MKLREKFLTVCQGCDGTGEYEEPIGGFENSVTYKLTQCDCDNGKELDWQKVDSEIKATKKKISTCKMRDGIYNEVLREIYDKQLSNLFPDAVKQLIENERELLKLENYLAELEVIE
jgi:hypothetical protein